MIRRWLLNRRYRRAARNDYWANDRYGREAHAFLAAATDPFDRAMALRDLAVADQAMGMNHDEAFGPASSNEDGTGPTMADAHLWSARLCRALATVEQAVATGDIREMADERIEQVAGGMLDQMASHQDLGRRMALLQDLYEAVVDLVGAQAAEVVACLPSPGMTGWMTVDAKLAWAYDVTGGAR